MVCVVRWEYVVFSRARSSLVVGHCGAETRVSDEVVVGVAFHAEGFGGAEELDSALGHRHYFELVVFVPYIIVVGRISDFSFELVDGNGDWCTASRTVACWDLAFSFRGWLACSNDITGGMKVWMVPLRSV